MLYIRLQDAKTMILVLRPKRMWKYNTRVMLGGIIERAVAGKKDCFDMLFQFSVYTDSIVCFALGKVNQLFVMNLVVENSRERDRQSRAMSHFVAIIRERRPLMKWWVCICK